MSSQNCNSTHELPRSSFEYPWKQSDFSHYFPCYANKRKAQIPLSPVFYYNLPGKYKKTNLHPAWNKPFHQFPYRSFLTNFPWGHHSRSTVAEQSTDLKYTGKPLPEYPTPCSKVPHLPQFPRYDPTSCARYSSSSPRKK